MTDLIKRDDALALLDLIAGGEEYIDDRERLVAAIPTIDPATIDAETQAMGDAMLYGVGIMQGGKHINLQYFFAQPDPAAIREAALREAMEIAKACERQNYARVTDDEKHGFYRAGLRSAGQAIAAAINARIEKGAAE